MKFNQTEQSTCCKRVHGIMFLFPFLSSGECSGSQHIVTHWHSRVIVAGRIQIVNNSEGGINSITTSQDLHFNAFHKVDTQGTKSRVSEVNNILT